MTKHPAKCLIDLCCFGQSVLCGAIHFEVDPHDFLGTRDLLGKAVRLCVCLPTTHLYSL
jgi:hypothetical protein